MQSEYNKYQNSKDAPHRYTWSLSSSTRGFASWTITCGNWETMAKNALTGCIWHDFGIRKWKVLKTLFNCGRGSYSPITLPCYSLREVFNSLIAKWCEINGHLFLPLAHLLSEQQSKHQNNKVSIHVKDDLMKIIQYQCPCEFSRNNWNHSAIKSIKGWDFL